MADDTPAARLRILVVLFSPGWLGAARLPGALTQAGFSVASYCHPESYLSRTRYNEYAYTAPTTGSAFPGLAAAVREYGPVLLIPACDLAVRFFHNIMDADAAGQVPAQFADVVKLVSDSLGDPAFHRAMLSKIETDAAVSELGLRVPKKALIHRLEDALAFGEECGYPVVLKGEYGSAGNAVRICADAAEVTTAHASLAEGDESRRILAQQYIDGIAASQATVAWSGEVLETVTLQKLFTHPAPMGPSSVLRCVDNAEAEQAVRALLGKSGYSGFGGAGFIIEHGTGAAYFIEFNPRPTPPCLVGHLFGRNLCRALWCRLSGTEYRREPPAEPPQTVALFPNEWLRDPHSVYLTQGYHDAPWDDPALLKAYVEGFVR